MKAVVPLAAACLCLLAAVLPVGGGPQAGETGALDAVTARRVAAETESNLREQVLAKWFPRAVDTRIGGFHQNYAHDWSRTGLDNRSVVCQARLTWVAAQAARRYPKEAETYKAYTRHGLHFLETRLWDRERGGFHWALDDRSRPDGERGGEKHVYGIAFAIYACAAAYRATGDPAARDLARRAFAWLEEHAHDDRNGGYFEALTPEGKPKLAAAPGDPGVDAIGTPYGRKSMNAHIHLLEAFTALYEVAPEPRLRTRLLEVFERVRDRIAGEEGYLHLTTTPAWEPIPGSVSYGHDVETGYLLLEAATALGIPRDARTAEVARRLIDHALKDGWDAENGGFYDRGDPKRGATATEKIWWVQAEGLNALLLMHERYGRETPRYGQAFLRQWVFIRDRQVDPAHGGWRSVVERDGAARGNRVKSDAWTEAYHQARAMMNVADGLRRLAGDTRAR